MDKPNQNYFAVSGQDSPVKEPHEAAVAATGQHVCPISTLRTAGSLGAPQMQSKTTVTPFGSSKGG